MILAPKVSATRFESISRPILSNPRLEEWEDQLEAWAEQVPKEQ